jgi:hypothetical protein
LINSAGKHLDALEILKQMGGEDFVVGKIFNGGFEADVKAVNPGFYDWRIDEGGEPQISIDNSQKHGGDRSLFVVFNSATGREFRTISQTIVVEPGKNTLLKCFTEEK